MIITLCSFLTYERFKRKARVFNRTNKVLTQEDIESLANNGDSSRAIQAFESAVVSHKEVADGESRKSLYTSYPKYVTGLYFGVGHDGFRRAKIAYSIGNLSSSLKREDIKDAVSVLKALSMKSERIYTQILALNSLGIIGERRLSVFDGMADYLRKDLNEPSRYPIGALAFLEKTLETYKRDEAIQMLDEAAENATVKNGLLIKYFIAKNHIRPRTSESDFTISHLFNPFSKEDVIRGLELVGLVGPRPSFGENTKQAQIYCHLAEVCLNLIGRAGYIDRLNLKESCESPFLGKDSLIEKGYKQRARV